MFADREGEHRGERRRQADSYTITYCQCRKGIINISREQRSGERGETRKKGKAENKKANISWGPTMHQVFY